MSQQTTSPFVLRQLVEYVESRLGRKLKTDQLAWVHNFLVEHVPQRPYLSNIQLAQHIRRIGDEILRIVATHSQQREVVNVHEMLQNILADAEPDFEQELGFREKPSDKPLERTEISEFLGKSNLWKTSILMNPRSVYAAKAVLLESRQRDNLGTSNDYRWRALSLANPPQGAFGYTGSFRDIVAARIYDLRMPVPIAIFPAQNRRRVYTFQIEEFATQAYYGQNGTKFQFQLLQNPLLSSATSDRLETPEGDRGIFMLDIPLTVLNSITLTVYVEHLRAIFPVDAVDCVIDWSPGLLTIITTGLDDTPMVVGERVVVDNYPYPGPPVTFSSWQLLTTNTPPFATVVNVINNNTYELGIAGGVPSLGAGVLVIWSRIFSIPIEFLYRRSPDEFGIL